MALERISGDRGRMARRATRGIAACSVVVASLLVTGCASPPLQTARADFYSGRFEEANAVLSNAPPSGTDAVLMLMDRGLIRQAMLDYEASTADWLKAAELIDRFETRSATELSASFVLNDNTISYRGAPFERTLLHTFLAQNYLARGMWEDAGVEARNIVRHLEHLDGYPDDAYSRYVAGLCLELIEDPSNAALQYRNAHSLTSFLDIDERTGAIRQSVSNAPTAASATPSASEQTEGAGASALTHELVCFVGVGYSPTGFEAVHHLYFPGSGFGAAYAEFYSKGKYLGRSFRFANVALLIDETQKREAAMRAAKDIARIAAKQAIAHAVKQKDRALGELIEFVLLSAEAPDERRWETLPLLLQVARMPCPADLAGYDVVFKDYAGRTVQTMGVDRPLARNGRTFVSFCRDLPAIRAPQPPAKLP